MPIDILMPQLSPTMVEGRLAAWTKKAGDKISAGEIIAEVETDKATMEVEATDDGVMHKIIGKVGDDIAVGTPIAVMVEKGEKVPASYKPTSKAAKPEVAEKAADSKPEQPHTPVEQLAPASPMPKIKMNVATSPTQQAVSPATGRSKASPLAKRVAQSKGVDITSVQGTGPKGRITAEDVAGVASMGKSSDIIRRKDTAEKLSPMRKAIASRLLVSKQYVPHFYLHDDVNMAALLEARKQINAYADGAFKASVTDFIIKASAMALAENPKANAGWNEDSIVYFGNVDISLAVAVGDGLITPIVTNAEQKSLPQISQETKALIATARAGKLKPEQYEGGTFSISNLGMYGTKRFTAIVNPPQSAILAVGTTEMRAVADAKGNLSAAPIMSITISADHRVIDGALGAELLASVKARLESPATLLL